MHLQPPRELLAGLPASAVHGVLDDVAAATGLHGSRRPVHRRRERRLAALHHPLFFQQVIPPEQAVGVDGAATAVGPRGEGHHRRVKAVNIHHDLCAAGQALRRVRHDGVSLDGVPPVYQILHAAKVVQGDGPAGVAVGVLPAEPGAAVDGDVVAGAAAGLVARGGGSSTSTRTDFATILGGLVL